MKDNEKIEIETRKIQTRYQDKLSPQGQTGSWNKLSGYEESLLSPSFVLNIMTKPGATWSVLIAAVSRKLDQMSPEASFQQNSLQGYDYSIL